MNVQLSSHKKKHSTAFIHKSFTKNNYTNITFDSFLGQRRKNKIAIEPTDFMAGTIRKNPCTAVYLYFFAENRFL
uniref:Uncharacterized protein n=1 Tax=Anopheles atroparvus TaxID=41427 RepID=A0AAG5DLH3_ANOAO